MADNKLELVVEVDVNRANASIKTVNTGLSSIEHTAAKAARGTSSGIDGMTASMVKGAAAGTLLADSIKHALEWLKEWTIEAARHAANTERLEVVTKALATRHGESAEAAMKVVEAVKRIGFTMADAEGAVQKMIIADLGLDKAEGMARVAKDAAAVSTNGLKASEALEQIITAIESGRGRGLRELRIFVDLNKETERAQKLAELQGRTLSENEIIEVRRAAIMREATKLQGAAASQTDSLQAQTQGLSRDVDELREAVGSQFQGLLKEWVVHLRELVGFLKDNSSLVVKFAEGVLVLAGALGTVTVAMKAFKLGAAGLEATLGGLAMLRNVSFAFSNGLTGALVGTEVVLANIARLLPPVAAGLAVWWGGNKLLEHAQGNKQLDTTAEAIKKINARLLTGGGIFGGQVCDISDRGYGKVGSEPGISCADEGSLFRVVQRKNGGGAAGARRLEETAILTVGSHLRFGSSVIRGEDAAEVEHQAGSDEKNIAARHEGNPQQPGSHVPLVHLSGSRKDKAQQRRNPGAPIPFTRDVGPCLQLPPHTNAQFFFFSNSVHFFRRERHRCLSLCFRSIEAPRGARLFGAELRCPRIWYRGKPLIQKCAESLSS